MCSTPSSRVTGESRGVLAREALNKGLVQVDRLWRGRHYRRARRQSAARQSA